MRLKLCLKTKSKPRTGAPRSPQHTPDFLSSCGLGIPAAFLNESRTRAGGAPWQEIRGHGRKRGEPNDRFSFLGRRAQLSDLLKAVETNHFRPRYATANLGHPSSSISSIGFVAALLLSFAALIPVGCSKTEEAAPTEVKVQAAHPERGDISEQISADATLAPLAQAAISPKVTAPVKKFYVQRGSRVRAGELLATLENQDLQAAALDNKGAYSAAQGTYDIATGATVPEDTVKAELDLTQATANLNLAQSIVDSRAQLFAEGAIPGRDLDTAKAALVQAKAAHEIAQAASGSSAEDQPQGRPRERRRTTHFRQG